MNERQSGKDHQYKGLGWLSAISNYAKIYVVKCIFKFLEYKNQLPAFSLPKVVKYPVRENLACRLFLPSTARAGEIFPLLISIHGGGFALCSPQSDDRDNHLLCEKYRLCIVSVAYSKAPSNPFPTAVEDCAAIVEAILEDASLPVDRLKVAISGYSAGASLALSCLHLRNLQHRIGAVVAYYPLTDWARTREDRLKTAKLLPGTAKDPLLDLMDMFAWAYIPRGTSLQDPRLSPLYLDRMQLPQNIFIMSCEYDSLSQEAYDMARRLVRTELSQAEEATLDWEEDAVRWRLLQDVGHGFNSFIESEQTKEAQRMKRVEDMHKEVVDYLFQKVYRSKD